MQIYSIFPIFCKIQNAATMELLKNAFVASNADITIRESFNDPIACGLTEPTLFDEPFGEDATALEQCNFGNQNS